MTIWRKFFISLVVVLAIIVSILLVVQFAGAPIARNYVNSHSQQILGRDLVVGNVKINPFTGKVILQDVECKEANREDTFLHFEKLDVQCRYLQLLHKEVVVPHIYLDSLDAQIFYEDKRFNFTDIIEHFIKDTVDKDTTPSGWNIQLEDIRILRSNISYNIDTRLENINLVIPGLYFGNQKSSAGLAFCIPDDGGNVWLNGDYNMAQSAYNVEIKMDSVNSDILLPFIQKSLGENCIGARIGGDVKLNGNLNDITNITLAGALNLKDIHYTNGPEDKLLTAEGMQIDVVNGNLKNMLFTLNADLLNVDYSDETMYSPFKYHVDKIHLTANSLDLNGISHLKAYARLQGNGTLSAEWNGPLSLEKGRSDAKIVLKNMQVQAFSPFCEDLFAYPIEGGNISITSSTSLNNGDLNSYNQIDIYRLAIGQKNKKIKADLNVPLKLGVSLLEDMNKKIALEIPVTGNVKEPKFSLGKVIMKAVGNMILDAVAAPIVAMAKASNKNIDMNNLQVNVLRSDITNEQYATLDQIAELLKEHPEMRLIMTQRFNFSKAQSKYKTKGMTTDVMDDAEQRNQHINFYLTKHHAIDQERIEITTADRKTLKKYIGKDQYSIKVELMTDPSETSEEVITTDEIAVDSMTNIQPVE